MTVKTLIHLRRSVQDATIHGPISCCYQTIIIQLFFVLLFSVLM